MKRDDTTLRQRDLQEHLENIMASITNGIVKEHGGRLDVKSETGNGTTFIMTLPAGGRVRMRERTGCRS